MTDPSLTAWFCDSYAEADSTSLGALPAFTLCSVMRVQSTCRSNLDYVTWPNCHQAFDSQAAGEDVWKRLLSNNHTPLNCKHWDERRGWLDLYSMTNASIAVNVWSTWCDGEQSQPDDNHVNIDSRLKKKKKKLYSLKMIKGLSLMCQICFYGGYGVCSCSEVPGSKRKISLPCFNVCSFLSTVKKHVLYVCLYDHVRHKGLYFIIFSGRHYNLLFKLKPSKISHTSTEMVP